MHNGSPCLTALDAAGPVREAGPGPVRSTLQSALTYSSFDVPDCVMN